ncbi:MAG: RNA polymerase sigma-70 factor [Candidatus Pedobacter colombiensis]|uniref:RNA polymerase sigma-70 factor n=1 Tax=Candidatus Pedobacter colombiensis TaxID=3121371 RepID=A0AAJ5W761_9SPHI|nr:RNA polymerase sigma-70 factor [Pedobacter sp.]WEK18416.1 MAG: RNA polymerase sigma-70 factor [Pedobacter sp.]
METASITNGLPINMGKEDAFEEMYRSYFAPLCFFAQKYIDQEDAEDVINNLFLKLWRQKELFESIQHAQSSLYVATRNSCLDFLKIAKRAEDRHTFIANGLSSDKNFIEEMIRTEVWAEIYREINKLPVQCSKVISLSFLEGLKNDEIAKALDISIQTVKNQKSMGVKLLKQKLSKSGFLLLCMYM